MAEYQYTGVPGKLKNLLTKLREVGVPQKVTLKWLESIGFASSNDRSMLSVLDQIGFIDNSDTPTDKWRNYRGEDHRRILAEGIRSGYADLFHVYPNAYARSQQELESFFSTRSSSGRQVISKVVATFRNLCELADFGEVPSQPAAPSSAAVRNPTPPAHRAPEPQPEEPTFGPKLHIDLQIHISPESTAEQIDQIFASMAKHLYKPKERKHEQ